MTLLYLDVDGPLIPFGGTSYATFRDTGSLLDRVDPAHGPRLLALGCELVWATMWGDGANAHVAPLLGLPPLPVVAWPDDEVPPPRVHWKTPGLIAHAAGRPFAWLDDEIGDADRAWVAATHPGRALLRRVDARVGLTDGDHRAVAEWTAALPRA